MPATTRKQPSIHLRALATSTALAGYYREMYRLEATVVSPKKIIRLLNQAGVRFVLMGTHGLGGWRSQARATQDVDVLVIKKDHRKAARIIREAFPKLTMEESAMLTRFRDPVTQEPRIDLMKPLQQVFQMVFRHTHQVGESHRIPDLEMALISKFAAMTSPHRERHRKMQDAADFADVVVHKRKTIDLRKLGRLVDQVYAGRKDEVLALVENVLGGGAIQV